MIIANTREGKHWVDAAAAAFAFACVCVCVFTFTCVVFICHTPMLLYIYIYIYIKESSTKLATIVVTLRLFPRNIEIEEALVNG